MSPFKARYGQEPLPLLRGTTIPSRIEEINPHTQQRDSLLKELRENLLKAQDQIKRYVDRHRQDVELEVRNCNHIK